MLSIRETASSVGKYTDSKIRRLQKSYLSGGGQSTTARARLARLRRLQVAGPSSWIQIGEDVFEGFSDLGLHGASENKALKTVAATMQLYAIHQQSKDAGMAYLGSKTTDEEGSSSSKFDLSFGESCRALANAMGEQGRPGVIRRLSALEGASDDFDGVVYYLRSLITLMKSHDVQVDYRLLASDLYLLQHPSYRDSVFMKWARDFYSNPTQVDKDDQADANSASLEA